MKKLISLGLIILVAFPSAACIKKTSVLPANTQSLAAEVVECLVMDSANALIPNAKVVLGDSRDTLRTGFDGRILIPASALSQKMQVEAEGYKSLTLKPSQLQARPLIVRLTEDGTRHQKRYGLHRESYEMSSLRSSKGVVLYAMGTVEEAESDMEVLSVVEDDIAMPAMGYAGSAAPRAGKLTAGEVNDFAKWALWDGVLNGSHKQYVKQWEMAPAERFVVQLTNKEGFPLSNRQVQLVGDKGTLFQARTDNTGKAELWLNVFTNQPTAKGKFYLEAEGQRVPAKPFSEGINNLVLSEPCAVSNTADVLFIMDATGSMGDELRYMTAELQDVIRRSQTAVEGLQIRTGALVYRDHSDDYLTRISRLSDDIKETQAFLDKQQANGGGDYEEAIPEALMAAINAAGWNDEARARIAFLIFDAPCHNDSATLALLHEQVLNAAAQGIRLVPVVCSGLREAGELLARSMALLTNGTSFFLTDDSGIGESHLKPTTDELKVEHLNDMLVRTIIEFTRMPDCQVQAWEEEALEDDPVEAFLPNPTDDPSAPLAENVIASVTPNPCTDHCVVTLSSAADVLCLVDVTGKNIRTIGAVPSGETHLQVGGLATGVYFVKALVGGQWYTSKVIIRGW